MEAWVSKASSLLVSSCVRSNLGYELLGEANRRLVEDDVEGLKSILADDGQEKRGVMLVFACVHGASRCATYLVKQGAMQDVDMTAYGETLELHTPITVAALLRHWEVFDALVEGGAEAHTFDSFGFSALSIAARSYPEGNLESLLRLEDIRHHINMASLQGVTPLMVASASAVPLLVEAGADVNLVDERKGTALFQACLEACVEKVKALVEYGADKNQAVSEGWTPLIKAANKGRADIVDYLLARPGINLDAKTAMGVTALDFACQGGHLEVVKLLVGAGARIEGQEGDELGALTAAIVGGHLQVVKYLVQEAGTDERRTAGASGWTSLMVAASHGHPNIVEYLLGRPAINIDAKTAEGRTALDYACGMGHMDVVKLLVAAGATLNAQASEHGPLRGAALGGHLHVIKYLVEEAGAEEGCGDPQLKAGLLEAMQKGHTDVVEYLRPIVSRREKEALRAAEERAAAAAAALLEEEERAAAAKEASARKKKKKGKKKGGAAAPSHTPSTPAPEEEPTSTLEASETPDDTQTLAAVLASTTLDGEGSSGPGEEGRTGGASVVADADPEEPGRKHGGSADGGSANVVRIGQCTGLQGGVIGDSAEAELEQVLEGLSCPITCQLMTDPVVADDGHTYQQAAIEEWINKCIAEQRPVTSPLTGATMGTGLKANLLVRSLARNFVRSRTSET